MDEREEGEEQNEPCAELCSDCALVCVGNAEVGVEMKTEGEAKTEDELADREPEFRADEEAEGEALRGSFSGLTVGGRGGALA
jgi:hypothetical protein